MRDGWRAQPRDPSLGATRRCGTAYEAAWPGRRDSDDSGRLRRRPDQPNEPGRCLSVPERQGGHACRAWAGARQTQWQSPAHRARWRAGGHAEQVEAALQCAIRPEGRHDRAAALCASDGERACAATGDVVERERRER
eukprot:scaffold11438_cov129-Isochrysis_galbana.AAC.1